MAENQNPNDPQISFSRALRERIGHHIHGEQWASNTIFLNSRER